MWPQGELQIELTKAKRHDPHKHQAEAINKVFQGFAAGHDRRKLIMACGTGKRSPPFPPASRLPRRRGELRELFMTSSGRP